MTIDNLHSCNSLDEELRYHNSIVAFWLLYYEDIKNEYNLIKKCKNTYEMEASFDLADKIAIPKSLQINSVYYLSDINRWLGLIENIEKQLPFNLKVFLTLRRIHRKDRGRIGWTASVQWRFSEEFSVLMKTQPEDVWIQSRNTWTRWWRKIVEYTVRQALKNCLLK